jgi:hypothetical protein
VSGRSEARTLAVFDSRGYGKQLVGIARAVGYILHFARNYSCRTIPSLK